MVWSFSVQTSIASCYFSLLLLFYASSSSLAHLCVVGPRTLSSCLFLHLGSNICSWVGDYVLSDDGGCNGDANTTKEEEEIAVSDHFLHSRHRVRMNLHLFISFFLSICTQTVLQLSVSCCYAAVALRGNTQNSNSLKTFFGLPSSWCVCRA